MRHLIRLDHWTPANLEELFALADRYAVGEGPRWGTDSARAEGDETAGCAALFFPPTSLRTRVTFERAATLLGLQPIVFPPESLDRPEALDDVASYLANWVDVLVVRHADLSVLEQLAAVDAVPVVNAMTDENHPCEVLSDLYALSKMGGPPIPRFVFVGPDGNIARAWAEASRAFGLSLVQVCPDELATPRVQHSSDLRGAVAAADVILTDGPGMHGAAMAPYRVTADVLAGAPDGVRLAPCPPFVRGREVSADALEYRAHFGSAVDGPAFVGHAFKAALLPVQQAVLATVLGLA